MSCGACNQPGIYRSPSAPPTSVRCRTDACGFNKTNSLGFILRDHAFSVVTAQNIVQESNGESGCPTEHEVCLRLPCDVVANPDNRWTTPLVLSDGTPFFLQKGDIIQKIVVAVNNGLSLDNNVSFILGTLGCDCNSSNPTRFIDCTCPITGCILNQVCAIKVVNVSVPPCFADCATTCTDPCANAGCTSTGTTFSGCTAGDPGNGCTGANYVSGERFQSMIGLTVLCGNLFTYNIRVFVQYLSVHCSGPQDNCNTCFN